MENLIAAAAVFAVIIYVLWVEWRMKQFLHMHAQCASALYKIARRIGAVPSEENMPTHVRKAWENIKEAIGREKEKQA